MTLPLTPIRSVKDILATPTDGVFLIRIDRNGVVHAHSRESTLIDGRHTARSFFGSHSDEQLYYGIYADAKRLDELCSGEVLDSLEDGSIFSFGEDIAPFLVYHKIEDDLFVEITDGSLREFESADDLLPFGYGRPVVMLTKRSERE